MKSHSPLTRSWYKLSITSKFSLAFGVLLVLMILVASTGLWALNTVRKQTEAAIVTSMQIQRLVLEMDQHLQQARRQEKEFFLRWPTEGFQRAHDSYVTDYDEHIATAIDRNSQLQRLIKNEKISTGLQEREADLTTYTPLVNLYANSFNEAVALVSTLDDPDQGMLTILNQQADALQTSLIQANDPQLLALFSQMRVFEKEYLLSRRRPQFQLGFNIATMLQDAIEASPNFTPAQAQQTIQQLNGYVQKARALLNLDNQIQTRRNGFDLQATTVDPIVTRLIVAASNEVIRAQQQIADTSALATALLIITVIVAVVLAVMIALLLNKSITRNVVKLNRTAMELQSGNLKAQATIDSADELGQLAETFNLMAARLDKLVLNLEAEAETAQNQLMVAIKSMSEGFSLFDANDQLVLANDQYKQMRPGIADLIVPGVAFETLIKAGIARGEYLEAIGQEEVWLQLRIEQHRNPSAPFEQQLADGRWLEIAEYKTQDGGILTIRSDFTRRKKVVDALRMSEEKFSNLFHHSSDGIFIYDMDGYIVEANQRTLDYFGYSKVEMLTMKIIELHPPGALEKTGDAHEKILANGYVNFEIDFQRKDKSIFPSEVSANIVEIGNKQFVQGIVRDITERKQTQIALEQAKSDAEAANRAKSVFLANMSHELRTPLNAIIGYSDMLMEDAADMQLNSFLPDLDRIQTAGRHLLALVSDVLDLSKIEAGKMDLYLEDFEVALMIKNVVDTVKPLVDKNHNTLQVICANDAGHMHADLTKTRQTLFNLLSNACKFTQNGLITIKVERQISAVWEQSDWIIFRVQDSGIGMTPDQTTNLFNAFTQADASTTRKYGGTGLGLAISQRFCRLMGGEIGVESNPGQGSVFTVQLPAYVAHFSPETEFGDGNSVIIDPYQPNTTATPNAGTVLVIDDDPVARDLLERYLVKDGYHVVTVTNGQDGLKLAKEIRPAVITLDVMMPTMDGWAVLTSLKSDTDLADIPVIMLTMVDNKNMGYALGAADYLTKPIDRQRMLNILDKYRCEPTPCPVLIVEDDEAIREMMRRILEKDGWAVVEAENGQAGLNQLQTLTPHLILLDLMMPEMDGFQFIMNLRQNPQWQTIPVIVVTAMNLTAEEYQQLNGYVEKILQKGAYSRDELLNEVRTLVAACLSTKAA